MTEIDVHRWETDCWKCGKDTPVVWPHDGSLDSDLGEQLSDHPDCNIQQVFSKSLGKKVWGNVCDSCDAYQGNHFIREEAIERFAPPVECPQCDDEHDWYPDEGMGGAFGQGWIDCPEYGPIPMGEPDF